MGPKLWEKPITIQHLTLTENEEAENYGSTEAKGAKLSVMNFDEFLLENNLNFDRTSCLPAEDIFDVQSRVQADTKTKNVDDCR